MSLARILLTVNATLLILCTLDAQMSTVPSNHPVYDWLHRIRVAGDIPFYLSEVKPHERSTVYRALKLSENEIHLTEWQSSLYRQWKDEFHSGEDGTLPDVDIWRRELRHWGGNREPHFYSYSDSSFSLVLDVFAGIGYDDVRNEKLSFTGTRGSVGIRLYGTMYDRIGYYLDVTSIGVFGDREILEYDPLYGKTINVTTNREWGSYDAQGFISYRYGILRAEVGRGHVLHGTGVSEQLVLSANAPYYDYVRLEVGLGRFHYQFVHAALVDSIKTVPLPEDPQFDMRVSRPRWLSMHRFHVQPWEYVDLGFSEAVIYGNRGIELGYMIPLIPRKIIEHELIDQDKTLWWFDVSFRPINGFELYGTWLIDDMDFEHSFTDYFGNKFGWQSGLFIALPWGQDIIVEYTRVDPFVYSHWIPYNAYAQRGWGLGHSLGPNSGKTFFSIRQWLPWRGWIQTSVAYNRKGYNIIDANGDVIDNVGGDIFYGIHSGYDKRYLQGDLHRWLRYRLHVRLEPWRGIAFSAEIIHRTVLEGERFSINSIFRLGVVVGK
jgi:hypothetical protein